MTQNNEYWNHQMRVPGDPQQAQGQTDFQVQPQPFAQPATQPQPVVQQPQINVQPQPVPVDAVGQVPASVSEANLAKDAMQPQSQFQSQPQPQTVGQVVADAQQASTAQSRAQVEPQGAPSARQVAFEQQPFQAQPQPTAQVSGVAPSAHTAYAAPAAPAAAAAAAPARKQGKGWIVAIVVTVCLLLFACFCVKSCTDSLSQFSSYGSLSSGGLSGLDKDAIAILDLDGTIQYDGTACSPEGFKELLDEAQDDEHVKALVLRVNSGGGTATAGEEMAEYLRQFEKPVVVSSASINASAAYEISAQADYIYVAKSTEIGAIGTAMQMTDLSGLLEKLGISMETITSADSKDSSYGYRALTDEERKYYQDMVDKINEMFLENVAEGRNMQMDQVRKLATGLAFTGVDAVDNGLADAVGTREDAVKKAAELAGISDYTTVDLQVTTYDLGSLAYLLGEDRSQERDLARLKHLLEDAKTAGLL